MRKRDVILIKIIVVFSGCRYLMFVLDLGMMRLREIKRDDIELTMEDDNESNVSVRYNGCHRFSQPHPASENKNLNRVCQRYDLLRAEVLK